MTSVYLSIGSNIDRERNIRSSISRLRELFGPLTLSSVYQSQAIGFDGADFYNLAVGFDTMSSVQDVHRNLRQIEEAQGRQRGAGKYSSRPLDIDLLLFGDMVQHTAHMDIPRIEIMQYAFVLLPLVEIAADVPHPEITQTLGEIWDNFDTSGQPIEKVYFDL